MSTVTTVRCDIHGCPSVLAGTGAGWTKGPDGEDRCPEHSLSTAEILAAIKALDALPGLIYVTRVASGMSTRTAAAEAGVDFATFNRAERGMTTRTATARALLAWIARTQESLR